MNARIVARGERAAGVFASADFTETEGDHSSVVVADDPSHLLADDGPHVVLSKSPHLSVPAFDICSHNPISWRRVVENRVAALGPRHLLPDGVKAHLAATPDDRRLLHRCHHIEDVAAFHTDPVERAGTLARVAATGVPIHLADDANALTGLLGDELLDLFSADIRGVDADKRESLSIKTRRIALRDHSFGGRLRQIHEEASIPQTNLPTVSILLPTKRPEFLRWAIDNVARQNYPRLELVLGLHGEGFDTASVENHTQRLGMPVKLVRVTQDRTLGEVLNAVTLAATGYLLTKVDDDDLYDRHHVWDLVLAHQYSGAELVGKGAESIYLANLDQTIERYSESELFSRSIAGGTLLISRETLREIGGWSPVPQHVDDALIDKVIEHGGLIYRTYGAGFLLIRHGQQHTWSSTDIQLASKASTVHPGWKPAVADIDGVPRPYVLESPA